MRRFFQAAVFSLLVTGALVVAAPSKRTATARLEIWVLAVLVGLALASPRASSPALGRGSPRTSTEARASVG